MGRGTGIELRVYSLQLRVYRFELALRSGLHLPHCAVHRQPVCWILSAISAGFGDCRSSKRQISGEALAHTAARFGAREALIVSHQGVRLTWGELDREVTRTARGLAGLGLAPGDRAGIWASNCVEWVLLQYAAARAGVVLVNVNPAYRSHELRYVLRKSNMRALFLRAQDARSDYRAILAESRDGEGLPLEHVVWLGEDSWQKMLYDRGRDCAAAKVGPHDVANIQYTSGTTGSPKGVLLSHHNLLNNGMVLGRGLNATERDRVCAPVPLYLCFGSVIGSMVSVVSGAALILPGAQFDALATLEAVHRERATALYGVPTMFIAELGHAEFGRFDLTSLRTGVMAGAPCPIEIMKQVVERMHIPELTIIYGQTEASPGITMSRAGDPLELRVTTVGTVLPNTEVQIVNPQTRERVPVGEQGELCARGYLVMKGYDQDPAATSEAVDAAGWLHTGRPGGAYVRTAISVFVVAPGIPSFAAERISIRARWKISCTRIRRLPMCTWSAFRMRNWERRSWPGCNCARGSLPPRKRFGTSAAGRSPTSKCRSSCALWRAFRRR